MKTSLILLTLLTAVAAAAANDEMYPPAPAAQKAIQIDGRGFTINGQRTYVASGSIHYPRVPHDLWRDRLLRLKRAGFNTVETYAFWNFHEPRENEWDFSGRQGFRGLPQHGPRTRPVCDCPRRPLRLRRMGFGRIPDVAEIQAAIQSPHRRPGLPGLERSLVRQDPAHRRRAPDP